MGQTRRTIVTIILASFGLSAVLGIAALLGGREFGELQSRVLLTTVIVGAEAVAGLCYLSVAGRRTEAVGLVGAVVSLVPFAVSLLFTWSADLDSDGLLEIFGVTLTVAAALAHTCLLLALRATPPSELVRVATIGVITVLTAMISWAILDSSDLSSWFWRALGILAILDVLGTLAVTVLAKYGGDRSAPASPDTSSSPAPEASSLLAPWVEKRVVDAAAARDMTPSQLVSAALDRYLG